MLIIYALLQLIALITITTSKRSECVSDKYAIPKEKIVNTPRTNNNIRNLQEQESRPIRITYDLTILDGLDPKMRNNLENK